MPLYHIKWEIDVEAETPRAALDMVLNRFAPEAYIWNVTNDATNETTCFDLENEYKSEE